MAPPLQLASVDHCLYAFSVLDAELQGSAVVGPNFPDAVSALFVTWNIQHSSGEWRLRGCIGTLEPRQLRPALRDYALISALRDSRFAPVTRRELSQLCCKVSLLSCFEVAADWQDWVVGTHGIIIEFSDPESGCRRSATFLPDVPPEQGWSVRDTLDALLRKAGFRGQVSASLLARIKLTRYQSSIASLTHEEYVRVRGEVQQLEGCWAARTGQEQEQQVAA
ncbi:AMMECR1 domain-containing protein [Haematococcus lacustris]